MLYSNDGSVESWTAEGSGDKMRADFADFEPRVRKLLSFRTTRKRTTMMSTPILMVAKTMTTRSEMTTKGMKARSRMTRMVHPRLTARTMTREMDTRMLRVTIDFVELL